MDIRIRYFASLRERLGRGEGRVELAAPATVGEIWRLDNGARELPAGTLCAVDFDYVSPDTLVTGDAEVAFFPPVTGG